MLHSVAIYHCMQFQGKLMNQTWENGRKPSFGTDFGPCDPNLGPKKIFHQFFLYYILDIVASYHYMQFQGRIMNQTWENAKKPSFGPNFGPFGPNLGHQFFFFKNLAATRYHGQLSSCTISEKTNDPILRKLSDGRTDGQTDRQTDESDFTGRCPTNVERPKMVT